MNKIKDLEKEIEKHRKYYYQDRKPKISDAKFDQLVKKLKKQKPDSPILKKVGYLKQVFYLQDQKAQLKLKQLSQIEGQLL